MKPNTVLASITRRSNSQAIPCQPSEGGLFRQPKLKINDKLLRICDLVDFRSSLSILGRNFYHFFFGLEGTIRSVRRPAMQVHARTHFATNAVPKTQLFSFFR